jgi:ribosome-binding factor A
MDSRRRQKVGKMLLKEVSDFFQKNAHFAKNGLITITDVEVTADLSIAKIHISFLNVPNKGEAIENIREQVGQIRGDVGNKIRHAVRKIPEFQFYLDDSGEYADNIQSLLTKLEIPPEEESDDEEETKP